MKNIHSKNQEKRNIPEQAAKFFDDLLYKSFQEIGSTSHKKFDFQVAKTTLDELKALEWQSIMLTVASSNFRLVSLVHFPSYKKLNPDYTILLDEHAESDRKYKDFISETGNNLCGVACNILATRTFSTGLSTPTLIENLDTVHNIRLIDIDYETHVCGMHNGSHQLCASFYVFKDSTFVFDERMRQLDFEIEKNTGELEFF